MTRILLFIATNIAIMVLLTIILTVFGVSSKSMTGMLIIALVIGMGGSFISLAISKWMAKRTTGMIMIDNPSSREERWLVDTIQKQADAAGIGMPEVGIFESPEMNAFATGMKRNDALVAVSTGLLDHMNQDEVEAVLAHEVSHIANGDMITMALLQGVINTFVILAARLIAGAISSALDPDGEGGEEGLGWIAHMVVVIVLEMVLGFFASMITMWFSRKREYSADADAAKLVGNHKMIAALERLKQDTEESHLQGEMAAFGIAPKGSFMALLASHPPLENRIAALR
ncbi:MAG TPA: protease HtpX [Leucothrix mucor]|uniref:Protease HtpX n=1 Tax=Leucothrix mucor TaxID=45248 RepID=A0A7V2T1H7_LEUMU|nr:protease HtpX [Leucothrix mucor]